VSLDWNWLDWTLVTILVVSVFGGLVRGFARVAIGLVAAILGILAGLWFYGIVAYYLVPYLRTRALANFVGFLVIFVLCLVAGALLGRLVAVLLRWSGLGWMDRLLGAGFGAVRGLIIGAAAVLALAAFPGNGPPKAVRDSRVAPHLLGAARVCARLAPRELRQGFDKSYAQLQQIWRKNRRGVRRDKGEFL